VTRRRGGRGNQLQDDAKETWR